MESESHRRPHQLSCTKTALRRVSCSRLVGPSGTHDDWHGLIMPEVKVLHEAGERILTDEAAYSIAADFTSRGILTVQG